MQRAPGWSLSAHVDDKDVLLTQTSLSVPSSLLATNFCGSGSLMLHTDLEDMMPLPP